jgi:hypothetical protein
MWVIGSIVFLVPAMLIALELAGGEKQSGESLPVCSDNRKPAS